MKVYEAYYKVSGKTKFLLSKKNDYDYFWNEWIFAEDEQEARMKFHTRNERFPYNIGDTIIRSLGSLSVEMIEAEVNEILYYTFEDLQKKMHADDFVLYCNTNKLRLIK